MGCRTHAGGHTYIRAVAGCVILDDQSPTSLLRIFSKQKDHLAGNNKTVARYLLDAFPLSIPNLLGDAYA